MLNDIIAYIILRNITDDVLVLDDWDSAPDACTGHTLFQLSMMQIATPAVTIYFTNIKIKRTNKCQADLVL